MYQNSPIKPHFRGLDVGHWNFPHNTNYVDQTETCVISTFDESNGNTQIQCRDVFEYNHNSGFNIAHITRSIKLKTSPHSTDRGHLLHTGTGRFEIRNTRVENFGRTTTDLIDSTVMHPSELKFEEGIAEMIVTKQGANQIGELTFLDISQIVSFHLLFLCNHVL